MSRACQQPHLEHCSGLMTVYHHHMMHMIHHVPCPINVAWFPPLPPSDSAAVAAAATAIIPQSLIRHHHHHHNQNYHHKYHSPNSCNSSATTPSLCWSPTESRSSPAMAAASNLAIHPPEQLLDREETPPSPSPELGAATATAATAAAGGWESIPAIGYLAASPIATEYGQPVPTVPLNIFYAQRGVHYDPVPWNQSFGMERVWLSQFNRIFSQFHTELWSIQAVNVKPRTADGIKLHIFIDSAKVRYCCERCNHCWTSMKGRVVFWFALLQPSFNVGIVACKLFGQRCDLCNLDGTFEQPMWYPEEVTKVLMNLYYRVGQVFYGFEKTKYERQLRMGRPRTEHNKTLCQACHEGICQFRAVFNNRDQQQQQQRLAAHRKKTDIRQQPQPINESYDSEDSGVTEPEDKTSGNGDQ